MILKKILQKVRGNNNIVTGTGDIHVHEPAPPVIPRQLPSLDACFLGRDKDLTNLIDQLHPGKVVAVCGPGGMGKSALAAQAVHKLEKDRFPDGIIFHSFYGHPETEQALQIICAAFQVEAKAGLETTVKGLLANRKALLILDGAEEANDLKAVLDLRSTCGVLITSRKRDDAQGFRLDLVPLEDEPAAEVLREHSGLAANDTAVQGICTILDGWPVGLRIAGRYLSSTGESASDYLRWLEQEPFKELGDGELQEENAALLVRRSVTQVSDDARLALGLAGTLAFAPIAREPVAAILDDERRSRKALGELINYGLLEKSEERWKISHALIHTYARTELVLSRESLERLAGYYINFCETQSEAGLEGYARLDGERAHCLRLMENCLASGLVGELSHLVVKMDNYLDLQGHWVERQTAFNMMLTAFQQLRKRKGEGWCLNQLGLTCRKCGKYNDALDYFKQALRIFRKIGDKAEEGTLLHNIGWTYEAQENYKQSLQYYEQSLNIRRKICDRSGEGMTLNNIAMIYTRQGKYKTALKYLKQDITICRDANNKVGEATTLNNIGVTYYKQNNIAKAMKYWEQALSITQEFGDKAGEAGTCGNIGDLYAIQGDFARAEKYIAQAVQIAEDIGHPSLKEWRNGLEQVRAERRRA